MRVIASAQLHVEAKRPAVILAVPKSVSQVLSRVPWLWVPRPQCLE